MVVVGAIVIALALRGGDDGGGDGPRSAEQIVDAAARSVALIKDEVVSGTGFMVADGIMATNAHVVRRMLTSDMQVYFPSISRERYTVDWIVYLDDHKDLALLSIRSTEQPLPLAGAQSPKRGAELLLIGNPGVGEGVILENAVSRGLAGPPTQLKGQRFLQISASINPGNSGGPAIDRRGHVVGMVTLKAANKEGLAFAIPAEDIAAAVRSQTLLSDSARLQLNQKLIGGAIFLRLKMAGRAFLALTILQVNGLRKALESGVRTVKGATPYLPDLTARTAKVRSGIGANLERYIRMIEGSRWMDARTKEDLLDFQQLVQTFDARASRPDVLSVLSYLAEFDTLHTKFKDLENRLHRRFDVPKDD